MMLYLDATAVVSSCFHYFGEGALFSRDLLYLDSDTN